MEAVYRAFISDYNTVYPKFPAQPSTIDFQSISPRICAEFANKYSTLLKTECVAPHQWFIDTEHSQLPIILFSGVYALVDKMKSFL